MTRLERLLHVLRVVLTQSPRGRHHGAVRAVAVATEPALDDAPTVAFSRLANPYPSQEQNQ